MPSAITDRPNSLPKLIVAPTITISFESARSSRTKDLSIFSLLSGKILK